jgi:hypothetical protein
LIDTNPCSTKALQWLAGIYKTAREQREEWGEEKKENQ